MRAPDLVKKYLSPDQHKLYDLIWSRALSSQMKPAQFNRNTITITLRRTMEQFVKPVVLLLNLMVS